MECRRLRLVHFSITSGNSNRNVQFEVTRTDADGDRDQRYVFCYCRRFWIMQCSTDITSHERMMKDMTQAANILGGFLPGVYPQFMVGLKFISTHILEQSSSLIITGTGNNQPYDGAPLFPPWVARYWLHFGHRARPVLGTILRLPLRTPNPEFMEFKTCGLAETVAFLMPLLQIQLAQVYVQVAYDSPPNSIT